MKLLSNEKNHNRWRKGIRWNSTTFFYPILRHSSYTLVPPFKKFAQTINSISFYQEKNVRLFLFIKKYLDSTITHFLRFTTFIRTFRRENCLRSSGPWPPSTWRCSELKLFARKKKKKERRFRNTPRIRHSRPKNSTRCRLFFIYPVGCQFIRDPSPLYPLSNREHTEY